jgi:hypothetical protein
VRCPAAICRPADASAPSAVTHLSGAQIRDGTIRIARPADGCSHPSLSERLHGVTDAHDPSQTGAPIPGEQWTLGDTHQIQEVFRRLAIPPLSGYTPVAITAVGVVVSSAGEVGHDPVYA